MHVMEKAWKSKSWWALGIDAARMALQAGQAAVDAWPAWRGFGLTLATSKPA